MQIHKAEIYDRNKADLSTFMAVPPHDRSISDDQALENSYTDRVSVDPKDERDHPHYTVIVRLQLLTAAVKGGDEYKFLGTLAKGIFQVAGDVSSGALSNIVVDGVNCGTSTVEEVKKLLEPAHASFNTPFIVPVHVHKDKKYRMEATISGLSTVTDVHDRDAAAVLIPGQGKESDETATISSTLTLCTEDAFTRGGVVDTTSERTAHLKSNEGVEYNIEGLERSYSIFGAALCPCLPQEEVLLSEVHPTIYVQTDGAVGGAACSIAITRIRLEYWEYPCEHRTVTPRTPRPKVPEPGTPHPPASPGQPDHPRPPETPSGVRER